MLGKALQPDNIGHPDMVQGIPQGEKRAAIPDKLVGRQLGGGVEFVVDPLVVTLNN